MRNNNYSFGVWLLYFVIFEVVVFFGLNYLLSDMGYDNQYHRENTIVPNWVKAVIFILLYILCLVTALLLVSNFVPSKHRRSLMRWLYLALIGMIVMLVILFN